MYCRPLNAGIPSEPGEVAKSAARLLNAMTEHISGWVVDGAILADLQEFRCRIIEGLKADGYRLSHTAAERWSVRPPKE